MSGLAPAGDRTEARLFGVLGLCLGWMAARWASERAARAAEVDRINRWFGKIREAGGGTA